MKQPHVFALSRREQIGMIGLVVLALAVRVYWVQHNRMWVGADHFEPGIDNLFKAIGRKYEIAYRSERQRLWDVVVRSIDAGRPVVALEWSIDHFAVLAGYDSKKREFLGRRYATKQQAPDEYVPIKLRALGWVLAIGDRTEKISGRQAALGAIRFAVASARTGKNSKAKGRGGTNGPMIYGPAALAEHARMIPTGMDPKDKGYERREHWLFWRLDALHLARGYAVLHLQGLAK